MVNIIFFDIEIRHKIFLLSKSYNAKVFKSTLKETFSTIFKKYTIDIESSLEKTHHEFFCQYNETDLNFISRLLSYHNGFYFYNQKTNKIILANNNIPFAKIPDKPREAYFTECIAPQTFQVLFREKNNSETTLLKKQFSDAKKGKLSYENVFYSQSWGTQEWANNYLCGKASPIGNPFYGIYKMYKPVYPGQIIGDNELIYKFIFKYSMVEEHITDNYVYTCHMNYWKSPEFIYPNNHMFTALVAESNNVAKTTKDHEVMVKLHFNEDKEVAIPARLGTTLAGKNYGALFIPRGGQEVLVVFLDNHMTSLMIIASMYNQNTTPPFTEKDNVTYIKQETLETDGQDEEKESKYCNLLMFDDKKDSEIIQLSGRKTMNLYSTKFMDVFVGEKTTEKMCEVEQEYKTLKYKDTDGAEYTSKTVKHTIQDSYTVSAKTQKTTIEDSYKIKTKTLEIEADSSIKIKCGGSTIEITPSGIKF